MQILSKLFSTLYIDFRGEVLQVVQGRPMDNNLAFRVDSFGSIFLPEHLDNKANNEVLTANASLLKNFLAKNNMNATKVVAGLGQSGVITRNVRVPKLSPKDLDSMMKLNINDHLPVSLEEYAFDYKVMREVEEDQRDYLELMVAAVQHNHLEQCASLLEKAGLKPLAFDILPNMLHRLFGHLTNQDTLVVNGGQDGSRIAIFKGGSLFMYTDIPFALDTGGYNDFSILANEIRGFLDYFSSRNFGKNVDNITILGELAAIPDLPGILGEHFTSPVMADLSLAGPLKYKGKSTSFKRQAAVYAGNLGLMMRESNQLPSPTESTAQNTQASSGITLSS